MALGWWINHWVGMVLFSLPLLIIFYYVLYRISLVIIPASNPEDSIEKKRRFLVFLSYAWGMQMSIWNVSAANAKNADLRIEGHSVFVPLPGMIRMDTHQVVGIANGNTLRVAGPGVVFTGKGDIPVEVVDLRNQIRTSTFQAFTREGIPFRANLKIEFCIDREEWAPSLHHDLSRKNPLLRNGNIFSRAQGRIFSYSSARVQTALLLRSKRSRPDGEIERWDDHVLVIVEGAARETLAGRSVNDLWQARENEQGNASGEITRNIRVLSEDVLRAKGVMLIMVKTSDFNFANHNGQGLKDDVIEQQLTAWTVERERELRIAQADALARAKRIEEESRMNARSVLLTAIVEGLKQARIHHPNNDPKAIAQVYLDALKNMIDQQLDYSNRAEAVEELLRMFSDDYFSNKSK